MTRPSTTCPTVRSPAVSISVTCETPAARTLARGARRFLAATAAVAGAAALAPLLWTSASSADLLAFAALAAAAAATQAFLLEVRANHGFSTAILFLVAGAVILPPELIAPLALLQHLPDIARRRTPTHIQLFNVSNYALNGLAAWAAWSLTEELGWTVGAAAAIAAFVGLNHLLLATMLRLARGHSFRATGLFSAEGLSIDVVLAGLGVALAALVDSDVPLVAAAAVGPILLVHRLLALLAEPRVETA